MVGTQTSNQPSPKKMTIMDPKYPEHKMKHMKIIGKEIRKSTGSLTDQSHYDTYRENQMRGSLDMNGTGTV